MRNSLSDENFSKLLTLKNNLQKEAIDKLWNSKKCKSCGESFDYKKDWKHIPNFCTSCSANYKQNQVEKQCPICKKLFSFDQRIKEPHCCSDCSKKQWIEKKCRICKKTIYIHMDWKTPVIACKECYSSYKESHPEKKVNYYAPQRKFMFFR